MKHIYLLRQRKLSTNKNALRVTGKPRRSFSLNRFELTYFPRQHKTDGWRQRRLCRQQIIWDKDSQILWRTNNELSASNLGRGPPIWQYNCKVQWRQRNCWGWMKPHIAEHHHCCIRSGRIMLPDRDLLLTYYSFYRTQSNLIQLIQLIEVLHLEEEISYTHYAQFI